MDVIWGYDRGRQAASKQQNTLHTGHFFSVCLWRINVILMLKINGNSAFSEYIWNCALVHEYTYLVYNALQYTRAQTLIDWTEIAVVWKFIAQNSPSLSISSPLVLGVSSPKKSKQFIDWLLNQQKTIRYEGNVSEREIREFMEHLHLCHDEFPSSFRTCSLCTMYTKKTFRRIAQTATKMLNKLPR